MSAGKRLLALVAVSASLLALGVACAPSSEEDAESSEAALARRGVDIDPPPPPKRDAGPKPPVKPPLGTIGTIGTVGVIDVMPAPSTYCGTVRYDLRRVTRTCEDLPGAFVDADGSTYVPGTGGRFKVERSLAGDPSAPASFVSKTCAYIWESASCAENPNPDLAKLLVEEPTEQIVPRAPGCQFTPNGCDVKVPPPVVKDGGIPTGIGRCEVCGFASQSQLWAVIPDGWTSFSYITNGERQFVQLNSSQSYYSAPLPSSVAPQDVTIYKYNSAP